jgi:glycosyltransferase involved in cell wall biosynthesis
VIVHQLLSGAGPYDAVTREALAIRALLSAEGVGGGDYAVNIDPRVGRAIQPLGRLRAADGDTLLIHYSAYAPKLADALDAPGRKVLLSHNVTPEAWFWDHDPNTALQCLLGRNQMHSFAERCDVVVGHSRFTAGELGTDEVVPLLLPWVDPAAPLPPAPPQPPTVLFVGRLVPHKRQDEIIRCFALLRRHRQPDARLVLVGEPLHERYLAALRGLADELAPGAVRFEHGLDDATLARRYREAHVFLCLSEHEGFCIPLLEAFQHGVPVVARPRGAVTETLGDAGLVLDGPLDAMAELCHLAISDAELRTTLRERGHARLERYDPPHVAARLRELLAF